MRKLVIVFCALFVFLVSGYSQSSRFGVSLTPQYSFFNKKVKPETGNEYSIKGNGLLFNGGIYYENRFKPKAAFSLGVGYTHLKTSNTASDTTIGNSTTKLGFLSIPIGISYEYPIREDKFIVGLIGKFSFEYLLSENSGGVKIDVANYKAADRLNFMGSVGINFMCFFTENFGASLVPTFSILFTKKEEPTYLGLGGSLRLFYVF